MKKDQIRVYIKEPQQDWVEAQVANALEALQGLVEGYIETVDVNSKACLIINEEGRLRDLPFNMIFGPHDLYGTIVAVGVDEDEFTDIPYELDAWKRLARGLTGERREVSTIAVEVVVPSNSAVEHCRRMLIGRLATYLEAEGGVRWMEAPTGQQDGMKELRAEVRYICCYGEGVHAVERLCTTRRQALYHESTTEDEVNALKRRITENLAEEMNRHGGVLWQKIYGPAVPMYLRCSARVVCGAQKE